MSVDTERNGRAGGGGDAGQRARLARILSDPAAYFAQARRSAHDEARRAIAARLRTRQVSTGR